MLDITLAQAHGAILSHEQELIALRRHLHAHPELSHHEHQTTALLAARLRALGYVVNVRPEGIGLTADLVPPGFDPTLHPTVAIRADMDALPIQELNASDYRSQNAGVMHACGHDVHMSCTMGASIGLEAIRAALPGRLRIVYQHAEESSPSGAPEMIAAGALKGVNAIIALHCDPERPAGQVGVRPGPMTASYDRFTFTIKGKSGHGARPHQCIDPIYTGTLLVQALYQATGRMFDAREAMVLSVGSFQAGHAPNIIPETATISGTVRTVSVERRAQVEPLLQNAAQAICALTGASFELDLYRGSPPLVNHPFIAQLITEQGELLCGHGGVEQIALPSMGSEDFAHYLLHIPGAMFRLGTASPTRDVHLLHSSRFDIDERAIAIGAKLLTSVAWQLLSRLSAERALPGDDDDG